MKRPLFSIIIPTLNEEKFIPKLLDSLVAQTAKDFEVIVVDGPSKDKTKQVVLGYKKKLPLTLVSSAKGSLPLQRNLGAKSAKGDWFIFIDADSILLPYFIDRCTVFLKTHSPELFTTWCAPDSEEMNDAIVTLIINLYWEGSVMFHRQLAPGPLAAIKREAFDKVNGYDESLTWGEDYDIAQRLNKVGVELSFLREAVFIVSLRRFRKEGTLKALQTYAMTSVLILITKRPPKNVRGYIMGGHFYHNRKPRPSVLKAAERKLKELVKEIFD